jgi:hypothetical protein
VNAFGTYRIGCVNKNDAWFDWVPSRDAPTAGAHCCINRFFTDVPEFYVETTAEPTEEPTPRPVETTKEPTKQPATTTPAPTTTTAPPTPLPTPFVPYSDLPGTLQEPAGCEARPALTKLDGDIVYCAFDGIIYLNGRSTCIVDDPTNPDVTATAVNTAFETNWYMSADGCEHNADYDTATDAQLYVTNELLNDLESDIDALEADMAAEAADLDSYLDSWKSDVRSIIEGSLANFDADTQAALTAYMNDHLSSD